MRVITAQMLTVSAAVLSVACLPAFSMYSDYTPVRASDQKNKVALKPVKVSGTLREGKPISALGCTFKITEDSNELEIQGKGTSARPWKILKHYYGLGTAIFSADLDRNGKQDFVLLQATGACGIAPPAVLTIILFDKNNFPNIYEFSGFASMDGDDWEGKRKVAYIDDIVDLNGDGKADIVTEQLDYADVRGKTRSFWRTVLYSASAAHLQKRTRYRGYTTPMIVAYKYKANHRVVDAPMPELKSFDDGSFAMGKTVTARVTEVKLNDYKHVETIVLDGGKTLSSTFDQMNRDKELFEPFLIVKQAGETAVLAWDTSEATNALKDAAERKLPITFRPRSLKGHLPIMAQLDLTAPG